MKIKSLASMVLLAGFLQVTPCLATSVGVSTIEQPVNLATKSDPTRIPLGAVAVVCNYNYGLHSFIGEARSAPDGAMPWAGGSELNQNLASVFGISVEPEDSTQIPAFSVTIRVKPWKTPAYSPYTKDQVVAATLWCLLRRVDAPPANPLEVRVVAEDVEDMPLEARYSGKFITRPAKDGEPVSPLTVPGTVLEEDARGIAWVVFPDVKKDDSFIPITPSAIILKSDGDGDPGWHVLPVWGNSNDPISARSEFLRLNHWSSNIRYSAFKSHGVSEANSYVGEGGSNFYNSERDRMEFHYPGVDQTTLAANLLALVISKQPTEAAPLTIAFTVDAANIADFPAFRQEPGWIETEIGNLYSTKIQLACEFVWDPVEQKLTKGSIPLVRSDSKNWIIPNPAQDAMENETKEHSTDEAVKKTEEATETKAPE